MTNISITIPDSIESEISSMTIEEILQAISNASSDVVSNDMKVDWQILKKEAKNFVSAVDSLEKEKEALTISQLKSVIANPEIASYVNKIRGNKERLLLQSQYMLAARFDDFLNKFRENQVDRSMVYVLTDQSNSRILGSFELSFRELILNADKRGRLNISNFRLTSEGREALEKIGNNELINSDHISEAQLAYSAVMNRLNRFYETHKEKQRQGGLLMWKEDEWRVGTIINSGDIKEGYVSFLFDKHKNSLCNMVGGSPPYYSHALVGGFFRNYIGKVTNLAAIVEEDVVTKNKQYGVKGIKASLPSFAQYYDTAVWIISQNQIMTKAEVEKWIRENPNFTKEGKRNIEFSLKEISDKEVLKILRKMQASLA